MPKNGGDTRLAITCAELAVAADLDFIYPPIHRMMTHSLTAVVAVTVAAWLIARRADRRTAPSVIAIVCGLAYGSHLAMDWIGGDTKLPPGIQLLWPFSDAWFISSWGVFGATSLGGFFWPETMLSNALTILRELFILGPIAFVAWSVRRRTFAGNGNATAGPACGPPRS
jgi:membrane-bound metal-dependent hydrolase YbcI (DUF457 family)